VFPYTQVAWDPDESIWNFVRASNYGGGDFIQWSSNQDVLSPELVTSWIPSGNPTPPTGDPVMELLGSAAITLTCATPGASIRYTTDGSYPAPSKTLYTAPITGLLAGTIVRTAAYATGLNPGDVTELIITE
jgi:hypothetical protein